MRHAWRCCVPFILCILVIACVDGVGRKQNKTDCTRRGWTDREEAFLLAILKELVATGWKSDNGFRSGYLQKCEDALRQEFPQSNLKANPHIQSKLHVWKKAYEALSLVLARSGVGFNVHNDYKIDCDEEQWEQIIRVELITYPTLTHPLLLIYVSF